MSLDLLVGKQNSDGGWPYTRGVSWTEPTAYAVLALLTAGEGAAARGGLNWLRGVQRPDGGWPPQAGIDESTWVTALAALIPPEWLGARAHAAAIRWLGESTGEESTVLYRMREWLLGNERRPEEEFAGWPWVPGTAAWVAPTSLAILALTLECRRRGNRQLEERIEAGRRFLLLHMCREGGWNHGSVRALGYESRPYPETTGLALAALRGVVAPQIGAAVGVALRFWAGCRSLDAFHWLRLGLLAQQQLPSEPCPAAGLQPRTVPEMALDLALAAAPQGRNPFFV